MKPIILVCGSAHSDRSDVIASLWKEHIDEAIMLTPTPRLARTTQESLVRRYHLPGLWGKRSEALGAFVVDLLGRAGRTVRLVSRLERRLMVRHALEKRLREGALPEEFITPGLVRHLIQIITQLKQAAIEPQAFRNTIEADAFEYDLLIASVYEHYQDALVRGGQYDIPGLYWEADRICHDETPPLPDGLRVLFLDGFDDFTPSQQRFLVSLSNHLSQIYIGLNYDALPNRSDLYHLQHECIQAFRERTDVQYVTHDTYTPHCQITFCANHIFWHDPPPEPVGLQSNVRVVPCAEAQHELETIGRRIKSLLVEEHIAPSTIAVALTDYNDSLKILRAVFDEFGIPYTLQEQPALSTTPTAAFILGLFEAIRDWDAQSVVSILTSPFFNVTGSGNAIYAIAYLVRQTGILSARSSWISALNRLELLLEQENVLWKQPFAAPADEVRFFRERFMQLERFDDAMPNVADLGTFARTLDTQITLLGIEDADDSCIRAEVLALRALLEELATTDFLIQRVTRNDFLATLREAMNDCAAHVPRSPGPGVYCTNVEGLRNERFSHVFIGGLNEGLTPRPPAASALYTERDLRRLRKRGFSLSGRMEHAFRERLLFHHGLCAAQQTLTLTWRQQDMSGRDALPSPFIVDICDLIGNCEEVVAPDPSPDCFLVPPAQACSPRELENSAHYHNITLSGTPRGGPTALIDHAMNIERERNSVAPFGIYDGVIQAPDLLARLLVDYGDTAQFSVTHLEEYTGFPFAFFLSQVLRIRETRQIDGELDPMQRGILLHDTLQCFHERRRGLSVADMFAGNEDETRLLMRNCVAETFRDKRWKILSATDVAVMVEQRRMERALDRYLTRECERGNAFKPTHFEVAFGKTPRGSQDPLSRTEPFRLNISGETICLSGKIDRIDVNGTDARIIDYKSSGAPGVNSIKRGLALQLTVYAWALEGNLLPDHTCVEAYYLPIYKGKPREALLTKKEDESRQRETAARNALPTAVQGIRAGYFPPLPHEAYDTRTRSFPSSARHEIWRIKQKCPDRNFDEDEGDV